MTPHDFIGLTTVKPMKSAPPESRGAYSPSAWLGLRIM